MKCDHGKQDDTLTIMKSFMRSLLIPTDEDILAERKFPEVQGPLTLWGMGSIQTQRKVPPTESPTPSPSSNA